MSWISIDFGTCNTAAAIMFGGKPRLVKHGYNSYFPSVACVLDGKHIEVCQNALQYRTVKPEWYVQEFKLNLHQPLNLNGADYQQIVSAILRHIREVAKIENNDEPVDNVVLTLPAIYTESDPRRTVMSQAAINAGFKRVEFLSEPKAAALHYLHITESESSGLTLVYDLGGGTFDPALIDLDEGRVISDNGVKCGGQYFDAAIYKTIAKHFVDKGKPLLPEKRWDDYVACRRLKEALSTQETASALMSNAETFIMSRKEFNELIHGRLKTTLDACDELILSAHKSWRDVKRVLLVGGSTAVPLVREMLKSHAMAHNADHVEIVMNMTGVTGRSYDHNYAVALGAIVSKIEKKTQPEPVALEPEIEEKENLGVLIVNGEECQLREGVTRFGRSRDNEFVFADDKTMSRHHFEITATWENEKYNYKIKSVSETKGTTVSGIPINANSFLSETELTDGDWIIAGRTEFVFKIK